jgi:hypothetical protein
LRLELLAQLELQRFPSAIIFDLVLLEIKEAKVLVPPRGKAAIGTMYITPRMETETIIRSFRPFGMGHRQFGEI